MRSNLCEVVMVIDRSGSMDVIKDDAEGGINTFIEEQKKHPGECNLTLVQFDTIYDFVHTGMPIRDVPRFKLVPRGGTALFDAVGRAINETDSRLGALAEASRPGLVVFVIVTDGAENSSKEFTNAGQIKEMIERQTAAGWKFTFLSSGPDAFAAGAQMGVPTAGTSPVSPDHYVAAYRASSGLVGQMRTARAGGASAQSIPAVFTAAERKAMMGEEEQQP